MSTTITRHPDDANLMSFAAGTLAEPLAAALASHVALCPRCRREMRLLRSLGGVLLAGVTAAGHSGPAPVVPAREPAASRENSSIAVGPGAVGTVGLPKPIAEKYKLALENIPWRWLGPGIRYHALPLSPGVVGDLRLLKIAAGRKMPEHGHGGTEMTLVLAGAFRDVSGMFGPGDIQDVDDDVEHRPIVDAELGCICLVASEQPARFKGVISRLLQPWTGM